MLKMEKNAVLITLSLRVVKPFTRSTLERDWRIEFNSAWCCVVPLLLVSKCTPSDVIDSCYSCRRGEDIASSGRDIVKPGFGTRG